MSCNSFVLNAQSATIFNIFMMNFLCISKTRANEHEAAGISHSMENTSMKNATDTYITDIQ